MQDVFKDVLLTSLTLPRLCDTQVKSVDAESLSIKLPLVRGLLIEKVANSAAAESDGDSDADSEEDGDDDEAAAGALFRHHIHGRFWPESLVFLYAHAFHESTPPSLTGIPMRTAKRATSWCFVTILVRI